MSRSGFAATLLGATAAAALLLAPGAGAKPKPLDRPADPVVLDGSALPRLLGAAPSELVAYRVLRSRKAEKKGRAAGSATARSFSWARVPVQVDERARVDFGLQPPNNTVAPTGARTVYGTAPIGVTALQYTDPATHVGADPDPSLDGDDEVALMAADAGRRAPKGLGLPGSVRRGGATALRVSDAIDHARSWVYLFKSRGKAKRLKTDYVSYDFRLISGDYKSTYKRYDGPNPEASTVRTAEYRAGYSDRWYLDSLAIDAGKAGGQDILDGIKSGFAAGSCGRSEASYNGYTDVGEGAFVANIDGPVRAIRSWVGANSGPLTQRTDVFYRSRQEVRIDLRVHPIPSILSYIDMGPGALGMTYRSNLVPSGVPVDGVNDAVPATPATWSLWSGAQGSLFSATTLTTSFPAQVAAGTVSGFYRDEQNTSIMQCWGDDDLYGSSGTFVAPAGGIPVTDPRTPGAQTLRARAVQLLGAPGETAAQASADYAEVSNPLAASASKLKSKK